MQEDLSYEEIPEFYHRAMVALGYEDDLRRYLESGEQTENFENLAEEFGPVYDNPLEVLDGERRQKVEEMAKSQAILNGDSGSLAGMDYLHTGAASD
jgi:hypothetical protein